MVLGQPAADLLQVKLFAFADNHHNPGDKQCTFHGYSNFFYGLFFQIIIVRFQQKVFLQTLKKE